MQFLNQNLLLKACQQKTQAFQSIKRLIRDGWNINTKNKMRENALHIVCQFQNHDESFEIVKYLTQEGIKVNDKNQMRETALHIACQFQKQPNLLNIMEYLIQKGLDINAKNKEEQAPLHLVCEFQKDENQFQIVKYMIEKKANINAKNKYNETPLHLLCEFQHPNTLKLIEYFIENKAEINAQTKTDRQEKKETPLHVACKCNYKKTTQVIKFLIEKGADINAKTKNNDTPLHFACQLHKGDSLKIIQYLIKKGADINAKNKDDKTPLHFVCHNQNQRTLEFVKFLIANGADINAKTKFGKTPLHLITQFQNEYSFEIAKFLIAKGADINAKNKDGKSSFNFVCDPQKEQNSIDFIIDLIEKGSKNQKNQKNQFIKQENDPKLINLMIENNANIFDLKNSKIPKEVVNSFFRNYSINQDLNNLFKLNDNFSDLQIESLDGCKFPVHKLILLTRLNNDESLLESFVKICSEKPKENVQLALNFLYTGFPNFDILTQILETLPDLESEVSKTEKIQEVETLFEKEEQKIALIQDFFKEISLDSDWIESKSKRKGILQDFTKLYEDNSTKDFKIICENKQIQVHKLILIIRSGLFKNMFLKVQDTSNQVHDYSGKSFETFKNFIYFLYHDEFGETTIIDEKLNQDLKYLKSFYQVNK